MASSSGSGKATEMSSASHSTSPVEMSSVAKSYTPLDSTSIPSSSLGMNAGPSQPAPETTPAPESAEALSDESVKIQPTESATVPLGATETETAGPAILINLLLTTGARHPYKISLGYLRRANIQVEDNDPFNITVYTLKELILRQWREDWEAKPLNPSSIRLIHMGRLLDDKAAIKDCRFNRDGNNVVHLTVKPQDLLDEEVTTKGKRVQTDGEESQSRGLCRCSIL